MKAFGIVMALWAMSLILLGVQTYRLKSALAEVKQLTMELDVTRAAQRADRETFKQQIKLIREVSANAQDAHKGLAGKAGLSDADWLNDVLGSMWNKNSNGGRDAAGVDAGAVSGAGSDAGTATGKDTTAVQ